MSGYRLLALSGVLLAGLLSGTSPAAENKPSLDADTHLLAWWKFDEIAGTIAADASPYSRKGTLEGGLAFDSASVPGRFGKAVQLDGKGQAIRISGFKGIAGPRPRTVSAWVKTTTPGGEIVSWGSNDAGRMFNMSFIRSRIGLSPKGGYLYMKAPVHDDAWHHVAIVVRQAEEPNLHDDVKLYHRIGRAHV